MANLSKERRDRMISKLEELKQLHNDDVSIAALNEIENALREKKYGLVWEEHSEAVDDMLRDNIPVLIADPERRLCKNEKLPWSFIIEGDNLQALYLLEKTHRGKVDCIYIDPPYNTGARDWKYNNDYVDGNDDYRHSKWLSMMKSRLLVAKRLLNPYDSVLICTIDEKEYLHLGCLLEELFPEATMQMISSNIHHGGSNRLGEFSRTNEFIFFLRFGTATIVREVSNESEPIPWRGFSRGNWKRKDRPNLFYPIFINKETDKIEIIGDSMPLELDRHSISDIDGCETIFPLTKNGDETIWCLSPGSARELNEKGYLKVSVKRSKKSIKYSLSYLTEGIINDLNSGKAIIDGIDANGYVMAHYPKGKEMIPATQWNRDSHDATVYGSTILKSMIGERFNFPKSLYAVRDCINYFVANKPNAIIVDFFAGSGTTLHAVNLLNAEDKGQRKCVLVTNNELSEEEQKLFKERNIYQGDKEWEEHGIAKYVTWPRSICSIEGHDVHGKPLKGNYLGSNLPMADGFDANVKYFKCDWIPRKPDDYLLSNMLCLHIKELIELKTAREIDNKKNVLILSKSDFNRVFNDSAVSEGIECVWVNENIVFNSTELRKLREKNFRYIPREFFSQELKEVGEYV